MSRDEEYIILGIDPGTIHMGYGLIRAHKSKVSLLEMGVLHLMKYPEHSVRLEMIYRKMEGILDAFPVRAIALESAFFGKNVQSMLKLGRAQGVVMAASMKHGLIPSEYAPRKVKQSITGRGNATKEQVWEMVQRILSFQESLPYLDASDALAVALCHHYEANSLLALQTPLVKKNRKPSRNAKGDWSHFLAQNPDRLR